MAICPGWSLTSSNDSLNSSTDSPSSPNDYLSSPIDSLASPNDSLNLSNDSLSSSKDSLTLSNDSWDQLQPTLMTLSAGKRGIDNEWIDRFPYLDPCHSVGYNRRCSCGRNNRHVSHGHMLSSLAKLVRLSTTKCTEAAEDSMLTGYF